MELVRIETKIEAEDKNELKRLAIANKTTMGKLLKSIIESYLKEVNNG